MKYAPIYSKLMENFLPGQIVLVAEAKKTAYQQQSLSKIYWALS